MKVTNFFRSLVHKAQTLTAVSSMTLSGVAVLSGGMAFVGNTHAASIVAPTSTVILAEDFENDGDDHWGGGTDSFGIYFSNNNWSNSPHSGVTDGGSQYGHLIDTTLVRPGTLASMDAGPLVSVPIDLTPGDDTINFDGWMAAWTDEGDHARFQAEFFSGLAGGGTSLGNVVLADGHLITASDGVTESVNSVGVIVPGDVGATAANWKHYVTSNPIPTGAMSVEITYVGDSTSGSNRNDAYADNVVISTSSTIPEPASIVLIGLSAVGLNWFVRRKM